MVLETTSCEEELLFRLNNLCVCCKYQFDLLEGDPRFTPYASKWDLKIHLTHDGIPASDALSLQFIQSMRLGNLQRRKPPVPETLAHHSKSLPNLSVQFKYPRLGHARIRKGCVRFEMFSDRIDPSPNHKRPYLKAIDIYMCFKRIDLSRPISLEDLLTMSDYVLASTFNSLILPLPMVFTDGSKILDNMEGQISALQRAFKLPDDTVTMPSAEKKVAELSEDLSSIIQDLGWNAMAYDFCFPIYSLRKDQLSMMRYETDPIAIARLIAKPGTLYESRQLLSSGFGSDLPLAVQPSSAVMRSQGELSFRPHQEDRIQEFTC